MQAGGKTVKNDTDPTVMTYMESSVPPWNFHKMYHVLNSTRMGQDRLHLGNSVSGHAESGKIAGELCIIQQGQTKKTYFTIISLFKKQNGRRNPIIFKSYSLIS